MSRDSVLKIQISHLRPLSQVSEKESLVSEFLSGSPGDSHIDMPQESLIKESYPHSILASPSGIHGCESYKKPGHLFHTGHPVCMLSMSGVRCFRLFGHTCP